MEWMPLSEQIDFVFPIPVPTQTLPPHRDTNSFLVGRREIGMIDAGLWDEKGVDALISHFGKETGAKTELADLDPLASGSPDRYR